MPCLKEYRGPRAIQVIVSFTLFLLVFLTHGNSRVITSLDSRWSILTGISILTEGNIDLNEFETDLKKANYYCVYSLNGKHYNLFPIGPSLLALPFIYLLDTYPGVSLKLLPGFARVRAKYEKTGAIKPPSYTFRLQLERAVASFIVALTSVLIYWIGKTRLADLPSIFIALIFAFGTSAWSQASRALWQHGPSMLFLSAALLTFLTAAGRSLRFFLFGIFLALAFIMRPTNALSLGVFSVLILFNYRSRFIVFAHALLISLAPFFHLNYKIYDAFLPPYYMPARLGGTTHFFEAVLGNLFSPARGLFIFSPFLLFCLAGAVLWIRDSANRALAVSLTAVILLHLISISLFPHWWGGHSFGPRLFSDMLPYFIYFLIPVICLTLELKRPMRLLLTTVFTVLLSVTVFIHFKGASKSAVQQWNVSPIDVDTDPTRVWDWQDLPFLR